MDVAGESIDGNTCKFRNQGVDAPQRRRDLCELGLQVKCSGIDRLGDALHAVVGLPAQSDDRDCDGSERGGRCIDDVHPVSEPHDECSECSGDFDCRCTRSQHLDVGHAAIVHFSLFAHEYAKWWSGSCTWFERFAPSGDCVNADVADLVANGDGSAMGMGDDCMVMTRG